MNNIFFKWSLLIVIGMLISLHTASAESSGRKPIVIQPDSQEQKPDPPPQQREIDKTEEISGEKRTQDINRAESEAMKFNSGLEFK